MPGQNESSKIVDAELSKLQIASTFHLSRRARINVECLQKYVPHLIIRSFRFKTKAAAGDARSQYFYITLRVYTPMIVTSL